jgi:hypothetical protein
MASLRTSGAAATMAAELKAMFNNKLTKITVILVILWCFFDALNRFTDKSINSNDADNAITITALSAPQLSERTFSELNKSYQQYISKNVDEKSKQVGLTAAEQAKQQGELKSFFIGDNKLQLKAVIQNKPQNLIALIQVENITSGIKTIEKFSQNTLVYGYTLIIEKNTQVKLTKQKRKSKNHIDESGQEQSNPQEIILTMYTSKA